MFKLNKTSMFLKKVLQKPKKSLFGVVEGISKGVVFGWAMDRKNPGQPLNLEFLADGAILATSKTFLSRSNVPGASPANGHCCGFSFDLKPYLPTLNGQKFEIRDAATGTTLSKTVVTLRDGVGWGVLDAIYGIEAMGWATSSSFDADSVQVEIVIDGEVAGTVTTDQARGDITRAGAPLFYLGYRFFIPKRWHDGLPHKVAARLKGQEMELRGGQQDFICQLQGRIEHFNDKRVTGWICNIADCTYPITFDLWVNDRCVKEALSPTLARPDVVAAYPEKQLRPTSLIGFEIQLEQPLRCPSSGSDRVRLCLPKTDQPILDTDLITASPLDVIQFIEGLLASPTFFGTSLSLAIHSLDDAVRKVMRVNILPDVLRRLRSASIKLPLFVTSTSDELPSLDMPIDVIIPVYKGRNETVECIKSVLAALDETRMELVVINDASPDHILTETLRQMAVGGRFTLLENQQNIGFVATVNKGMQLHLDRDVVLLNSDTVVPPGWLTRMRAAAYSAPNVATVTPFSNRATIFSLPRTCEDNDMVGGKDVVAMDKLCTRQNPGVTLDVPTAVGFCMFIRRMALREVGFFDAERYGKGYCEENDFCMRAMSLGWRNIAACDVFVQHHGSVSFCEGRSQLFNANYAKFTGLYPDYQERVHRFIATDPLAVPRNKVNLALLAELAPSFVLFISHDRGGGTDVAIMQQAQRHSTKERMVLILRNGGGGKLFLAPALPPHDKTLALTYGSGTSIDTLAKQLAELSIDFVFFHHTIGFPADIWHLPALLRVPFEVMLHDYYFCCPHITMIDSTRLYCSGLKGVMCEQCVQTMPPQPPVAQQLEALGGTVGQWRQTHEKYLGKARRIVAPSEAARRIVTSYYPKLNVEVVPHLPEGPFTPRPLPKKEPFRLAVIGAIGPHKGSHVLMALAKYAQRKSLPFEFVVIGYTDNDDAFRAIGNVEITGKYTHAELDSIVTALGCTVALFLSVWPETFSYTLSEAWELGLNVFAFDVGAIGDRIRQSGRGVLLSLTEDPQVLATELFTHLAAAAQEDV